MSSIAFRNSKNQKILKYRMIWFLLLQIVAANVRERKSSDGDSSIGVPVKVDIGMQWDMSNVCFIDISDIWYSICS